MKVQDPYKDFAKSYDIFGDIAEINKTRQDFFQNVFSSYGVKNILDCACGTGQHCYMFSKMGYIVQGSDISEAMLEQARNNFIRLGITVPLTQCDFRDLKNHFNNEFDAVVCLTTSLPHVHEERELIKALVSMKNVLKDKGIVIITQGTTHNSLRPEYRIEVVVNNNEFSRVFIKDIAKGLQTINILDIYHSQERNESQFHQVIYKILLDDDYKRLLKKAGFKKIKILGGYDMKPYNSEKSWQLIVIGEK